MSAGTKLLRVADDLGIVSDLLQAAFMATHALQLEEAGPMAALIYAAQQHLGKAKGRLNAVRAQRQAKIEAVQTDAANG